MRFAIFNMNTGEQLREYVTNRDDTIAYANTPVVQEGAGFYYAKQGERTLDKTKQLIRKMLNGNAVISVDDRTDNDNLLIKIGSYKEYAGGGNAGTMMAGPSGSPVFMSMGYYSHSTWKKTTRFESLLNKTNFEHSTCARKQTLEEKIEDYTEDIKALSGCEVSYIVNNQNIYAYYDHKKHTINIIGW